MGFGIALAVVFPKKAISQTITSYDEAKLTNPTFVYSWPDPQQVQKIVEKAATQKAKSAIADFCSCVSFVKRLTAFNEPVGAAKNWPINAALPQVGAVVVLNEGRVGHVAYVTALHADAFTVEEANYIPCTKSSRTILLSDPTIKGFWIN